jgi:hypothetical protein
VDDEPKTVKLLCVNGNWSAEMVVCEKPLTILTGSGSNVPDALGNLAYEIRLAEGKEDAEDEDDGAPNTTPGE